MKVLGTVALVTGANRGIGQQLVRALLNAGAKKVYAGARTLDSIAATLAFDPQRVIPIELDITSTDDIIACCKVASDVRLLVNNAAILEMGGAMTVARSTMRNHMDVNFHGTFDMCQAFANVMFQNGGGAIINVLSDIALHNAPAIAAYSASKAAALSLTKSLRSDLRSLQIDVHAVFPGPVDTDMLAHLAIPKASAEEVAREIVAGLIAGHEDIFPDKQSQRWIHQVS